ncbi:MAG: Uma2 family endonuclease [Nostoc sp.]|uniref:Uma2 family endonuclease n=1 Tax=Nostoc sp. TaxID=1180 RepID=UPI002FFB5067
MVNGFDYLTLETDCKQKAPLYAKAGIADYWILDVSQRQVYVFHEPSLKPTFSR